MEAPEHTMPRKHSQQPHQRFVPSDNCHRKRRFRSENEAMTAADIQMLVQPQLELTTYRCDSCGGWHLTRRNSLI